MKKEFIDQINNILSKKEIDNRVKPLIKLYFLGKSDNLTIEQLKAQIEILCSRISNVEFSSNNIVAAYSSKSNVLTINKKLFLEGKSDEVILPVFMKFESALNQNDNRREYSNHIEDFISAGRIAKAISLPISDRLYKLYEMAEYCYGDNEQNVDKLVQEEISWRPVCSEYNTALNKMIVTGKDNLKELSSGAKLFHLEVFSEQSLKDPNFEGPYKNKEYQRKAARVLGCIDKPTNQMNTMEEESLIKNIKLFTGCTQEMIEESKVSTTYTGNSKIGKAVEAIIQSNSTKISEEFIVSKVQSVINRKPDWDSRVKHLIIPFFVRSQKIYNWNIDEFQERLNQVDLIIDKIIFKDFGDIVTIADAGATTRLNSRVFLDEKRTYREVEKKVYG